MNISVPTHYLHNINNYIPSCDKSQKKSTVFLVFSMYFDIFINYSTVLHFLLSIIKAYDIEKFLIIYLLRL